jgi:hypothetical protein
MLEQLELHPLRYAFTALPKEFAWSPIWQQSPRRRSYLLLSRGIDCLAKLFEVVQPCHIELSAGYTIASAHAALKKHAYEYLKLVGRQKLGYREAPDKGFYTITANLQKQLSEIIAFLIDTVTCHWAAGYSDSLERAKPVKVETDRQMAVLLAEEFIALRFVAFIRYVMLQLRNRDCPERR